MLDEEQRCSLDKWQQRLQEIQDFIVACCTPPPERRDAAEHRRHILEVARRLFALYGVDNVSMHQIAQEAGVGQGTLYRRFAHKGELCTALLVENVMAVQERLQSYLESCPPSTTARAQLGYVLSLLVSFNEENAPLLGAVFDASCGPHRMALYRDPIRNALHQMLETLLERAVALKELPPIDTVYTSDAILASLQIDLYQYQRTKRGFSPERILQGLLHLFVDGHCIDVPRRA